MQHIQPFNSYIDMISLANGIMSGVQCIYHNSLAYNLQWMLSQFVSALNINKNQHAQSQTEMTHRYATRRAHR